MLPVELAKELNVPPSTIHRLLVGETANPRKQLLEDLAVFFSVPVELLTGDIWGGDLKVGAGFCLWSLPLVLPIMEHGAIEGVRLTTFGFAGEDGSNPNPIWHEWNPNVNKQELTLSPVFNEIDERSKLQIDRPYVLDHVDLKPLTDEQLVNSRVFNANDLLHMLHSKTLDVIAVPEGAYKQGDRSEGLLRIASIVYSAQGGCEMMVLGSKSVVDGFREKLHSQPRDLVFRDRLVSTITEMEESLNTKTVPTIFSRGTVAETYFSKYIASDRVNRLYRDTGNWKELKETLQKILVEEHGIGMVFLLGWQPQLSWVKRYFSATSDIQSETIDLLDESDGLGVPYHGFDLVIQESRIHELVNGNKGGLPEYLKRVNSGVLELNASKYSNNVSAEVDWTSIYFNLPHDDCVSAIRKLNFQFRYHPQWVSRVLES